tara:strand:- start:3512 stop:3775 length:264 start_codon:yes stop_codon:yes gene_type:complete
VKKIEPLPFQTLYKKNDNMYQNVVIVSERAKSIISENVIDLSNKEEGFDSTEEILESETQDFDKTKAIVTATNEFVLDEFDWNKKED